MISRIKRVLCLPALILFITACTITEQVPEVDSLLVLFDIQHVTIYGHADGMVTAHVTGGQKPYLFSWSNGCSDSVNIDLAAGDYFLVITDDAGQVLEDSIAVTQPDSLFVAMIAHDASQPGTRDGTIDMEIVGGVSPYLILWSNGDTVEDPEGLFPGQYWVRVTDAHQAVCRDTVFVGAGENALIDIDGNVYAIVEIGEQVWMRENLRVTHDPGGNPVTSYCFNDHEDFTRPYGRLYTWDAAMNGSLAGGAQGICPDGWHIPSDEEWIDLEVYLGMESAVAELGNIWRGTDEGAKLRLGGSTGYDIRYSGRRSSSGSYSLMGSYEYVWTSTESGSNAWRRCFRADVDNIGRWDTFPKTYAFSVRCIRDNK